MKKIFGRTKKEDKNIRPSSASDSTLKVPSSTLTWTKSTERITTTSYLQQSSSSTTSKTMTSSVIKGGTLPRPSYTPVYERTQKWHQNFERSLPIRHSTSASTSHFNNQQSPSKLSFSSPSKQATTAYSIPSQPSIQKSMQIDAKPFTWSIPNAVPQNITTNDLNVLKVKVKKCQRYKDHSLEKIPTYMTNSYGKRGSLLVINNMKFGKHEKERKGAEKDVTNIKELFRQMNFETIDRTNLTKTAMELELKNHSKKDFKQYDINVVVMMSHGCGDAESNSTQIIGTDGRSLSTSDVLNYFTNFNCPNLAGKPKIFIFQCCRGNKERIFTDCKTMTNINRDGDMLLAYATIPGFVSYRSEFIGSWYIQAICKVFMDNAHDTHVEDMLKMVDGALADKAIEYNRGQTSSYENRGFKCCYLNPI